MKRRPLHSAGSFGRVPPPQRYYGTLRLPATRLAALRCLRLAIPPFVPGSSPPARDIAVDQPGVFKPGLQPAVTTEMAGSLRFPSDPLVPTPCSRTPVGPMHARPLRRLGAAPACVNNGGSRKQRFRGSIARHWDSLFTLRREGHPSATQNSLPAAGQALPGGIRLPAGLHEKFPSSSLFPLSRAYLTL